MRLAYLYKGRIHVCGPIPPESELQTIAGVSYADRDGYAGPLIAGGQIGGLDGVLRDDLPIVSILHIDIGHRAS